MNNATYDALQAALQGNSSSFTWDAAAQSFSDGSTIVSARVLVDETVSKAGDALEALTAKLNAGELDAEAFSQAVADELRGLHLQSGSVAQGGVFEMSADDFSRIESRVAEQLDHIQALVEAGDELDAEQLGRWFASAGRATFESERLLSHQDEGFSFEQYTTHSIKQCDGCQAADDAGVQPIGTSPAIGERSCGSACDCTVDFFKENPDA